MAERKLDYKTVIELYEAGYNMTQVAEMVGSVNGHISKLLRKEGVETRKRGEIVQSTPLKEVYTTVNERGYMIELLLENGYSQYTVADVFGQAQSTVSKTLKAYRKAQENEQKEEVTQAV